MVTKKRLIEKLKKAVIGCLFVILSIFGITSTFTMISEPVYAEEPAVEQIETSEPSELTEVVHTDDSATTTHIDDSADDSSKEKKSCKDSLGAIGWLVCPTTGKIAEAVDWLYEKIEGILVINPISTESGSPIFAIWTYLKGVTNVVFIIFLLVVIYSQITGLGINNYGIKKALPKLIIAAVLVNVSFLICQLAVDVSNIVGNSLRGVFTTISESAIAAGGASEISNVSYAKMYTSIGSGAAVAIGGAVIAFETGAIWMLIPVVLGALVAVVSGLITIALRQAVVALLIMISPLAMVAYMLPNTEKWFKKWKDLLFKMLVFYPMFSLLFGASQLAGFAIIASAKDGFGLLLGTAVEIFPLFFSWSLMKMSGTFLGAINAKLNSLVARPLATNRAWADSHKQLTKQRYLASGRATTPSLRLMQFVNNRKVAREAELSEKQAVVKERGLAYRARRNYRNGDMDGVLSKKGEEAYAMQAQMMEYQRTTLRDKNNFNKGFEYRAEPGTATYKRLQELDTANVNASDMLKVEQARGEKIDYENAVGFHRRMEEAINAHMDLENMYKIENGKKVLRENYETHFDFDKLKNLEKSEEMARYNAAKQIMEGNVQDVQFAAASAAQAYDTQKKIIETKMQKYFELTPPTKDVVYRLTELTNNSSAINNIDSIIAGLRILNQRGDTDLLRQQMQNVLNQGLEVGTHASQSLASFLMFEVKDNDPFLRRFGKYINLETANAFDNNKRQEKEITYDEYVKGYHLEPDGSIMYAKRPMAVLMEGTSLDNVERTAYSNLDDSLMEAYSYVGKDNKKHVDVEKYLEKREEIQKAIGPQFISASLKYLSGSEQLKNAVSFLTGYSYSQKKDKKGNVVLGDDGKVEYEWKARWEGEGDLVDDPKAAEAYFRKMSLKYFRDQTPAQILGLRSDYKDPLMKHSIAEFLENPDHPERQEEYHRREAEIQTRYGDLSAEEAEKKREKDLDELRMEMAGKQVRKILGESGKLEQIYRTRRSGAANNAKDWVRKCIGLDDEEALFREVSKYKKDIAQDEEGGFDESDTVDDASRIYNKQKRKEIRDSLEKLWEDNKDGIEAEEFYNEAIDALRIWFGGNTDTLIEREFKKSYERRREEGRVEAYDLKKDLEDLLMEPRNYPDA